jgi:hypothetical protein
MKYLIKTAHERFRLGDIKLAMMTTPIFSHIVAKSLDNDNDRTSVYTNFTHLNTIHSVNSSYDLMKTQESSNNHISKIQQKLYDCIHELNKFITNRENDNEVRYTMINLENNIELQEIKIIEIKELEKTIYNDI